MKAKLCGLWGDLWHEPQGFHPGDSEFRVSWVCWTYSWAAYCLAWLCTLYKRINILIKNHCHLNKIKTITPLLLWHYWVSILVAALYLVHTLEGHHPSSHHHLHPYPDPQIKARGKDVRGAVQQHENIVDCWVLEIWIKFLILLGIW